MKALGKGSIATLIGVGLRIFSIILWIALVGVVIGAIAYAVFLGLIASGVIPAEILHGGSGVMKSGGATIKYDLDGGLGWQIATPGLAAAMVAVGGALIIVDRLRRLFDNFQSVEPFKRENADHLRVIWITLLVIEVSRNVLLLFTAALIGLFGAPPRAEMEFNPHLDLTTWFAILVLIVLAEVFREGARLREEQDLTI